MANLRQRGREAEDEAADFLIAQGYTVITRRYTTRHGEIDIVALDEETLVFVEVKGRFAPGFIPEQSIGADKLRNLNSAAKHYIRTTSSKRPYRYDVIAMDGDGLRHYKNAFG